MIYSLDKINEMADGDQDFVNSVILVFLEEVPTDLEALETAIEENDHTNTYMLAHKIKPNVELLGMEQTKAIAFEIETLGKSSDNMRLIKEKFPLLKQDVLQVVAELHNDFNL